MIRTLLSALRTLNGTPPSRSTAHPTVPDASAQALLARLEAVEKAEALRAAEHAAMVDQLTRLYKRVSMRIARSDERELLDREELHREATHHHNGESVLSMRNRLGR